MEKFAIKTIDGTVVVVTAKAGSSFAQAVGVAVAKHGINEGDVLAISVVWGAS